MKAFAPFATALLLAASTIAQQPLAVDTPTDTVECHTLAVSWSGGTPPYVLSLHCDGTPVPFHIDLRLEPRNVTNVEFFANFTGSPHYSCVANVTDGTNAYANSEPFSLDQDPALPVSNGLFCATSVSASTTTPSVPTSASTISQDTVTTYSSPSPTTMSAGNAGSDASNTAHSSGNHHRKSALIGAIVGSLFGLGLVAFVLFLCRKRITKLRRPSSSFAEPGTIESSTTRNAFGGLLAKTDTTFYPNQAVDASMPDGENGLPIPSSESSHLPIPPFQDVLQPNRGGQGQVGPFYPNEYRRNESQNSFDLNENGKVVLSPSQLGTPQADEWQYSAEDVPTYVAGGTAAVAENPRVQQLVVELRRELAGSSSQDRNMTLTELLGPDGSSRGGVDGEQDGWWENATQSTHPPPYEPDLSARPRSDKVS